MATYIDWDIAKSLSGIDDTLDDTIKSAISQWVEDIQIKLLLNADFSVTVVGSDNPEMYNIGEFQNAITLKNFPVISVSRVRDNIRATTPTTLVEDTNYTIVKETGTVFLIDSVKDNIVIGNDFANNNYFTEGINIVDVCYSYGYAAIPDDVKAYANMNAAKVLKLWSRLKNSGDVDSFTMGDYTEKIGMWGNSADSKFDPLIIAAQIALNSKYKNAVSLGAAFNR